MPDSAYYLRKLAPSDSVQNFKTGNPSFLPLKTFLQKQAKPFQQASIAQTYVAVMDDNIKLKLTLLNGAEHVFDETMPLIPA